MEEVVSKIDVLPCVEGCPGFVRLVKPKVNDGYNYDLDIVRNARVSYDSDWRSEVEEGTTLPKDAKLIKYLWTHGHTSPFESVHFTFEVKAPIFVFRQWHRHRTWSYNEVSARYTTLDEGFYVPLLDQITTQSTDNKQMRTTQQHPDADEIRDAIFDDCYRSLATYKKLIDMGAPRELARGVLPVNTYSRMFGTVNLHNLANNFFRLRMHEHSQYEIRVYAKAMLELIRPIVPITAAIISETIDGGKV